MPGDGVGDDPRGDAVDRLLARRVDRRDDRHVGDAQRLAELAREVARAREEMRLEERDDATVGIAAARGVERRADLGRMMRVVVDDDRAEVVAEDLEAAVDAEELRQRGARSSRPGCRGARPTRDRRERVQHVVLARDEELEEADAGDFEATCRDRGTRGSTARRSARLGEAVGDQSSSLRVVERSRRRHARRLVDSQTRVPMSGSSSPRDDATPPPSRSPGRCGTLRRWPRTSRSTRDGPPRCSSPPRPRGGDGGTCARTRRPRRRGRRRAPLFAFVSKLRTMPPTSTVGSRPASSQDDRDHRRGGGLAVRAGDADGALRVDDRAEGLGALHDADASARALRRLRHARLSRPR